MFTDFINSLKSFSSLFDHLSIVGNSAPQYCEVSAVLASTLSRNSLKVDRILRGGRCAGLSDCSGAPLLGAGVRVSLELALPAPPAVSFRAGAAGTPFFWRLLAPPAPLRVFPAAFVTSGLSVSGTAAAAGALDTVKPKPKQSGESVNSVSSRGGISGTSFTSASAELVAAFGMVE